MLNNEKIALLNSRVLLVPYSKYHVPKYHEWMKDPEIQEATASEPLTLEEEYAMQESWRRDSDKLTFIVCQPVAGLSKDRDNVNPRVQDADKAMVGDVNMFITTADDEEDGATKLAGELELMVASRSNQGKGLGRSALLTFLLYVVEHETEIVDEFLSTRTRGCHSQRLTYICAKIGEKNHRSIRLFESLGFVKTSTKPSYFGELELRRDTMSLGAIKTLLRLYDVQDCTEMAYDGDPGTRYSSSI